MEVLLCLDWWLSLTCYTSLELFWVLGFKIIAWIRGPIKYWKNSIIKTVLDTTSANTSRQIPYHKHCDRFHLWSQFLPVRLCFRLIWHLGQSFIFVTYRHGSPLCIPRNHSFAWISIQLVRFWKAWRVKSLCRLLFGKEESKLENPPQLFQETVSLEQLGVVSPIYRQHQQYSVNVSFYPYAGSEWVCCLTLASN